MRRRYLGSQDCSDRQLELWVWIARDSDHFNAATYL